MGLSTFRSAKVLKSTLVIQVLDGKTTPWFVILYDAMYDINYSIIDGFVFE